MSIFRSILTVLLVTATVRAADGELSRQEQLELRRTPVVDVFEQTRDAVVNIASTFVVETRSPRVDLFDLFRDNPRMPRKYQYTSLGSGFVITADGYVVTNAHVVLRSVSQKVIFADKTEYEAERVAVDEEHDLAVLKIKADRTFPTVKLGRSDDLMIGETVVAIGNPLGYEHTVTTGIVSALDRTLDAKKGVVYAHLIQTDASINPGNSGGPLLNVLGELVGINTAIRGDAQNIGFAIAVDSLRKLLPDMLAIEQHRRIRVGLRLSWQDPPYVTEVNGPALEAGVEAGDILLKVNDLKIQEFVDYYTYLLEHDPGAPLTCTLQRDGREVVKTIEPEVIPIPDGAKLLREKFGIHVQLLTPEQARRIHSRLRGGLLITEVEPHSTANYAGLQRGHLIVQIGRYFPENLEAVGRLLENVERGDKVFIRVWEVRPDGGMVLLEGDLVAR